MRVEIHTGWGAAAVSWAKQFGLRADMVYCVVCGSNTIQFNCWQLKRHVCSQHETKQSIEKEIADES